MNRSVYPPKSLLVCIAGYKLTAVEINRLNHPLVAGVILFSRNFVSSQQLRELTASIKALRNGELIIAVDNEGGRVQRFKTDEFTHLPAMGDIHRYFEDQFGICIHNKTAINQMLDTISDIGFLMANECLAHGVDISFAPVLDIDCGSDVVGDRAFHHDAEIAANLVSSFCGGMREAGMPTIGKHFPGHGSTKEDSHFHTPIDERNYAAIQQNDLSVFTSVINNNLLDGIMPAHIIFPNVDNSPVGYSKTWLQNILKVEIGFNGIVFSDDLSMIGAGLSVENPISYLSRYEKAIAAGCDIALICNQPKEVDTLLEKVANCIASDKDSNALTKMVIGNGFVSNKKTGYNNDVNLARVAKTRLLVKKIVEWKSDRI